jgi:hypothetical protein
MRVKTIAASLFGLFALLPAVAVAQDPGPPPQDSPAVQPPPPVVVYVPYPVPYVVYVPLAPATRHRHGLEQRTPVPPPPTQGIFAGAPATGIFAGVPATGIFAGNTATGILPPPPPSHPR